jgi:H+/Cl- antiporter ClcA
LKNSHTQQIGFYFRRVALSCLSGLFAGIASSIFLIGLDWATRTRDQNPSLIWFLPLAGLIIGVLYHRWGGVTGRGHNLIIDEIHDPKKLVPARMAPLVLLGTLLTHLFGGSAGREGTAVQMGASLSDQLGRMFSITPDERRALLQAGAGAGFGAAIGTPWAGIIFGMEVISIGRLSLSALLECTVASLTAYQTALVLRAPHSHFQMFTGRSIDFSAIFWSLVAGLLFGLMARVFVAVTHLVEKTFSAFVKRPPLYPIIGGIVLVLLFYIEHSYRFVGLGIPVIQESLSSAASFLDPVLKTAFTALTIGSGFKGGEFVPLVFIGTTLGSALSMILPASIEILSRVGFAAVFAGASNTPIACSIMAIEIFGPAIAPYAVVGCFASYFASGRSGIYKSQRIN